MKANSSARILKRRAEDLGLETSHFRGNRKWAEKDLPGLIASACTWGELFETLGYAEGSGAASATIKAHAARLGIDVSHLKGRSASGAAPRGSGVLAEVQLGGYLRSAAPAVAQAWFTMRGYIPLIPAEPMKYDLAIDTPDGFKRIQVKSTTCFNPKLDGWQVSICRRMKNKTTPQAYGPDEVCLFFIIDGDLDLYLIPFAVVGGKLALSLKAYKDYRVGNAKGLIAAH
jgi:hypothetical protein